MSYDDWYELWDDPGDPGGDDSGDEGDGAGYESPPQQDYQDWYSNDDGYYASDEYESSGSGGYWNEPQPEVYGETPADDGAFSSDAMAASPEVFKDAYEETYGRPAPPEERGPGYGNRPREYTSVKDMYDALWGDDAPDDQSIKRGAALLAPVEPSKPAVVSTGAVENPGPVTFWADGTPMTEKEQKQARVYQIFVENGHDAEGARTAAAVTEVEGGLLGADNMNDPGGGSHGPFQLNGAGELINFRRWVSTDLGREVTMQEAARLADDVDLSARFAATNYLGNKIKEAQAKNIHGAALATYAQQYGQVSIDPWKAGQAYDRMFANGDRYEAATKAAVPSTAARTKASEALPAGHHDGDGHNHGVATPYTQSAVDKAGNEWTIAFDYDAKYDNPFNAAIPRHRGVDLTIPNAAERGFGQNGMGAPYTAFRSGEVVAVWPASSDPNGGLGIVVATGDPNAPFDRYFHNNAALVKVGDKVIAGETMLGQVGDTGTKGFPHLHYEVSKNINGDPMGQTIDPRPYMSRPVQAPTVAAVTTAPLAAPRTIPLETPYTSGKRPQTTGIMIHATRGAGPTPEDEFNSTVGYFKNNASKVSANAVIAADGTVAILGDWDAAAHHAGENNASMYGIELAQSAADAAAGKPFTDAQYASLGWLMSEVSKRYGLPLTRASVIGHEESEQGKRSVDGQPPKSDPGPQFSYDRALAIARSGQVPVAAAVVAPSPAAAPAQQQRPPGGTPLFNTDGTFAKPQTVTVQSQTAPGTAAAPTQSAAAPGAPEKPQTAADLGIDDHTFSALKEWQRWRSGRGEDPTNLPEFRAHLGRLGAPDPWATRERAAAESRSKFLAQMPEPTQRAYTEWEAMRKARGEDVADIPAFRAHLDRIGAPNPWREQEEAAAASKVKYEKWLQTLPVTTRAVVPAWQAERTAKGEDPNDQAALSAHLDYLGVENPFKPRTVTQPGAAQTAAPGPPQWTVKNPDGSTRVINEAEKAEIDAQNAEAARINRDRRDQIAENNKLVSDFNARAAEELEALNNWRAADARWRELAQSGEVDLANLGPQPVKPSTPTLDKQTMGEAPRPIVGNDDIGYRQVIPGSRPGLGEYENTAILEEAAQRRMHQQGLYEGAHIAQVNQISRQTGVERPVQTVITGYDLRGYPINQTIPTPELEHVIENQLLTRQNQQGAYTAAQQQIEIGSRAPGGTAYRPPGTLITPTGERAGPDPVQILASTQFQEREAQRDENRRAIENGEDPPYPALLAPEEGVPYNTALARAPSLVPGLSQALANTQWVVENGGRILRDPLRPLTQLRDSLYRSGYDLYEGALSTGPALIGANMTDQGNAPDVRSPMQDRIDAITGMRSEGYQPFSGNLTPAMRTAFQQLGPTIEKFGLEQGTKVDQMRLDAQRSGINVVRPPETPLSFSDPISYAEMFVEGVPVLAGGLLASVAGGLLAGPAGAAAASGAFMFGMEGGGAYKDALDAGVSRQDARTIGNTVGLVNAALESLPTLKWVGDVVGPEANRLISSALGKNLTHTLASQMDNPIVRQIVHRGAEGLQEGSEEVWQGLVTNSAKALYDGNQSLTEGLVQGMVAGFLPGAAMGSTQSMSQRFLTPAQILQQEGVRITPHEGSWDKFLVQHLQPDGTVNKSIATLDSEGQVTMTPVAANTVETRELPRVDSAYLRDLSVRNVGAVYQHATDNKLLSDGARQQAITSFVAAAQQGLSLTRESATNVVREAQSVLADDGVSNFGVNEGDPYSVGLPRAWTPFSRVEGTPLMIQARGGVPQAAIDRMASLKPLQVLGTALANMESLMTQSLREAGVLPQGAARNIALMMYGGRMNALNQGDTAAKLLRGSNVSVATGAGTINMDVGQMAVNAVIEAEERGMDWKNDPLFPRLFADEFTKTLAHEVGHDLFRGDKGHGPEHDAAIAAFAKAVGIQQDALLSISEQLWQQGHLTRLVGEQYRFLSEHSPNQNWRIHGATKLAALARDRANWRPDPKRSTSRPRTPGAVAGPLRASDAGEQFESPALLPGGRRVRTSKQKNAARRAARAAARQPVVAATPAGITDISPPASGVANYGGLVPESVARLQPGGINIPTETPEFQEALANTPGAMMTEAGLEIPLVRQQKPEQDSMESGRTGVFYMVADLAKAIGVYAKGGQRPGAYHGGEQRIAGPSTFRRPMFIKGATGGRVPELGFNRAWEELYGKQRGSTPMQRVDAAISAISPLSRWGVPPNRNQDAETTARLSDLLQRWGYERGAGEVDPDVLAQNIVESAREGNQFRYMVREAVTAQALRDAGYDAVIGLTTTKGKRYKRELRMGEVFDVREATYPSEFNDGQTVLYDRFRPRQGTAAARQEATEMAGMMPTAVPPTIYDDDGAIVRPDTRGERPLNIVNIAPPGPQQGPANLPVRQGVLPQRPGSMVMDPERGLVMMHESGEPPLLSNDDAIAQGWVGIPQEPARAVENARDLYDRLVAVPFMSNRDIAQILGPRPKDVDQVIDYMLEQRAKVSEGRLEPADLAKAYLMTTASQGQGAIRASIVRDVTGMAIPDHFLTVNSRGERMVRPEDAMAAWIASPTGQNTLAALNDGRFDAEGFQEAVAVRAAFSDNRLGNLNILGERWMRPGRLSMRDIPRLTQRLNRIGNNPDALHNEIGRLNGIGRGKSGFMEHLLGFGENPTMDSRIINTWLTGQATIRGLESEGAVLAKAIQQHLGGHGPVGYLALARIVAGYDRLRRGGFAADIPRSVYNAVLHSWLWNRVKGVDTMSAPIYGVMSDRVTPVEVPQDAPTPVSDDWWGSFENQQRDLESWFQDPDERAQTHEARQGVASALSDEEFAQFYPEGLTQGGRTRTAGGTPTGTDAYGGLVPGAVARMLPVIPRTEWPANWDEILANHDRANGGFQRPKMLPDGGIKIPIAIRSQDAWISKLISPRLLTYYRFNPSYNPNAYNGATSANRVGMTAGKEGMVVRGETVLMNPLIYHGGVLSSDHAAQLSAAVGVEGWGEAILENVIDGLTRYGVTPNNIAALLQQNDGDPWTAPAIYRAGGKEMGSQNYGMPDLIITQILGSALRANGYDGVITWTDTNGRTGAPLPPYITEGLDAREWESPNQRGEADIHPDFLADLPGDLLEAWGENPSLKKNEQRVVREAALKRLERSPLGRRITGYELVDGKLMHHGEPTGYHVEDNKLVYRGGDEQTYELILDEKRRPKLISKAGDVGTPNAPMPSNAPMGGSIGRTPELPDASQLTGRFLDPTSLERGGIAVPHPGYAPGTPEADVDALLWAIARTQDTNTPSVPSNMMQALSPTMPDPYAPHNVQARDKNGKPKVDKKGRPVVEQSWYGRPASLDDLRLAVEVGLPYRRWYTMFGTWAKKLIGAPNLNEFRVLFGITSSRTPVNNNMINTLSLMRWAREFAATEPEKLLDQDAWIAKKESERYEAWDDKNNEPKMNPDGTPQMNKLAITNEQMMKKVVDGYGTGTVINESNAKTASYSGNILSGALQTYDPNSTIDTWMGQLIGWSTDRFANDDQAYRTAHAIFNWLAREKGLNPNEAQAAGWFTIKTITEQMPDVRKRMDDGDITLGEGIRIGQERDIFKSVRGDLNDLLQQPGVNNAVEALRAIIDPTQPGPGRAGDMGMIYPGDKVKKLAYAYRPISNEQVAAGRESAEAQAMTLTFEGNISIDAGRIPWLTVPHQVVPTATGFSVTLPGGNFETAQYAAALIGDRANIDSMLIANAGSRAPNVAGIAIRDDSGQMDEESLMSVTNAIAQSGAEFTVGPNGSFIAIHALDPEDTAAIERAVDSVRALNIDTLSAEGYAGDVERIDRSSYESALETLEHRYGDAGSPRVSEPRVSRREAGPQGTVASEGGLGGSAGRIPRTPQAVGSVALWAMPDQEIASADTSQRQVPTLMHRIPWKAGQINLDLGGGKYDDATEYIATQGVTSLVYDPFNRDEYHNSDVIGQINQNGGADTVTIANVLNVIQEPSARRQVLEQANAALKHGGTAYISVYQRDRSGVGIETSKGWQENRPLADYMGEVRAVFPEAKRKGDMIVAPKASVESRMAGSAGPVPQLETDLRDPELLAEIAVRANRVLDLWKQDEDGLDYVYGAGGICDDISTEIADAIMLWIADVDYVDGGQDGDDHAFPIIYRDRVAYAVDIPPGVYETGGGFTWTKIEGARITPDDIDIYPVDYEYLGIEPEEDGMAGSVGPVPVPTFYSQLARTIDDNMPNRATPAQIYGILGRMIAKKDGKPDTQGVVHVRRGDVIWQGDVKQDELRWTGFDAFLDAAERDRRMLTKPQVQEFLAQNALQMEEIVLGDSPTPGVQGTDLEAVDRDRRVAEAAREALQQEIAEKMVGDGEREMIARTHGRYYAKAIVGLATNSQETLDEIGLTAEVATSERSRLLSLYPDLRDAIGRTELAYTQYDMSQRVYGQLMSPEQRPVRWATYDQEQLVLPGGTNEREILITLPDLSGNKRGVQAELARLRAQLAELEADPQANRTTAITGVRNAIYLLETENTEQGVKFTHPHWKGIENVVGHLRGNDRITRDGRRIFFIEEVQSDWHQAGREHGYLNGQERQAMIDADAALAEASHHLRSAFGIVPEGARDELFYVNKDGLIIEAVEIVPADTESDSGLSLFYTSDEIDEMRRNRAGLFTTREYNPRNGAYLYSPQAMTQEQLAALYNEPGVRRLATAEEFDAIREYERLREARRVTRREVSDDRRVPEAPFAKNWSQMLMRRAIRWAAEHGYDAVAWTPGDVQNQRYNLEKYADEVVWTSKDGSVGTLSVYSDGQSVGSWPDVPGERVKDYIGSEVAEKLLGVEPTETRDGDEYLLYGSDLKVLGKGMNDFYNKMLVSSVNDMAKKWGARVGVAQIDVAADPRPRTQSDAYVQDVWILPITEEMKQSVVYKGQPAFSAGRAPALVDPFFSQLRKVIEDKMPARMPSDQVLSLLGRTVAKEDSKPSKKTGEIHVRKGDVSWQGAVKPDEVAWSGLEDFLAAADEQVSKEDVLAFLDRNAIKLEEVLLGETEISPSLTWDGGVGEDGNSLWWSNDAEGYQIGQAEGFDDYTLAVGDPDDPYSSNTIIGVYDTLEAAKEAAQSDALDNYAPPPPTNPTKYNRYSLPGGTDYRELLMTMPVAPDVPAPLTALPDTYELNYDRMEVGEEWAVVPVEQRHGRPLAGTHATQEAAVAAALEHLNNEAARGAVQAAESKAYKSGHWSQPNVLAHIRMNVRNTLGNIRALFVEEIQSDLHQAGRKAGYIPRGGWKDGLPEGYSIVEDEDEAIYEESPYRYQVLDAKGEIVAYGWNPEEARVQFERKTEGKFAPDAPFKATEQWAGLAFRRAIRYAVEQGHDRIAWTTGQQQAERYSLDKQLDSLSYNPETHRLTGMRGTSRVIDESSVTPDQLAENVGEEMAAALMAAEPNVNGLRTLTGTELKMEAKGMRAFYDRILVNVANKIGKPYGTQVGVTRIGDTGEVLYDVLRADGTPAMTYNTREAAEQAAARFPGQTVEERVEGGVEVHSMDITPAMKESVLFQGQPMFMAGPTPEMRPDTDDPYEYINPAWVDEMDAYGAYEEIEFAETRSDDPISAIGMIAEAAEEPILGPADPRYANMDLFPDWARANLQMGELVDPIGDNPDSVVQEIHNAIMNGPNAKKLEAGDVNALRGAIMLQYNRVLKAAARSASGPLSPWAAAQIIDQGRRYTALMALATTPMDQWGAVEAVWKSAPVSQGEGGTLRDFIQRRSQASTPEEKLALQQEAIVRAGTLVAEGTKGRRVRGPGNLNERVQATGAAIAAAATGAVASPTRTAKSIAYDGDLSIRPVEVIMAMRYNNLLLGPRGILVDYASNSSMLLYKAMSDAVLPGQGGINPKARWEITKAEYAAGARMWPLMLQRITNLIATGVSDLESEATGAPRNISGRLSLRIENRMAELEDQGASARQIAMDKELNKLRAGKLGAIGFAELAGRLKGVADVGIKTIAFGMEQTRQAGILAWREGNHPVGSDAWHMRVAEILEGKGVTQQAYEQMKSNSHRESERITFQGPMGTIGRKYLEPIQNHPIGSFVLPFLRALYHIRGWALDLSPLGAVTTMADVIRAGAYRGIRQIGMDKNDPTAQTSGQRFLASTGNLKGVLGGPYQDAWRGAADENGLGGVGAGVSDLDRRMVANVLGTTAFMWMLGAAFAGGISGSGPPDEPILWWDESKPDSAAIKLARTMEAKGWQRYSVRIPWIDGKYHWVSYSNWGPLAYLLASAAAIAEAHKYGLPKEKQQATDTVGKMWEMITQGDAGTAKTATRRAFGVVKDMSYLQGFMDLYKVGQSALDLYGGGEEGESEGDQQYRERKDKADMARYAGNILTTFLPAGAMVNTLAQSQDTYQRATEAGSIRDQFANRIPDLGPPIPSSVRSPLNAPAYISADPLGSDSGRRSGLPIQRDALGREQANPYSGYFGFLPFKATTEEVGNRVLDALIDAEVGLPTAPQDLVFRPFTGALDSDGRLDPKKRERDLVLVQITPRMRQELGRNIGEKINARLSAVLDEVPEEQRRADPQAWKDRLASEMKTIYDAEKRAYADDPVNSVILINPLTKDSDRVRPFEPPPTPGPTPQPGVNLEGTPVPSLAPPGGSVVPAGTPKPTLPPKPTVSARETSTAQGTPGPTPKPGSTPKPTTPTPPPPPQPGQKSQAEQDLDRARERLRR